MAILSTINCRVCRQEKVVAHSASTYPDTCVECNLVRQDAARTAHLASRAAMTVVERLALIEAELYDLQRWPPSFNVNTPVG